MPSQDYDIKVLGLKEMQQRFDDAPNVIRNHARDAMGKSVLVVLGEAKKNAPVYQGQMRNSMESKVEGFGSEVVGIVGSPIVSPYPYPSVVEFGRAPNSKAPPREPIARWLHLVKGLSNEEAWRVSFVKARAIGKLGIPARPFLHNALQSSMNTINGYFREAIRQIVNSL